MIPITDPEITKIIRPLADKMVDARLRMKHPNQITALATSMFDTLLRFGLVTKEQYIHGWTDLGDRIAVIVPDTPHNKTFIISLKG